MPSTSKVHYRELPARDYSLKSLRWYYRWMGATSVGALILYWFFVFAALCVSGIDLLAQTAWVEMPAKLNLPIFDELLNTLSFSVFMMICGLLMRDVHIKRGIEADEARAAYELLSALYAAEITEETPIHPTLLGNRER